MVWGAEKGNPWFLQYVSMREFAEHNLFLLNEVNDTEVIGTEKSNCSVLLGGFFSQLAGLRVLPLTYFPLFQVIISDLILLGATQVLCTEEVLVLLGSQPFYLW